MSLKFRSITGYLDDFSFLNGLKEADGALRHTGFVGITPMSGDDDGFLASHFIQTKVPVDTYHQHSFSSPTVDLGIPGISLSLP